MEGVRRLKFTFLIMVALGILATTLIWSSQLYRGSVAFPKQIAFFPETEEVCYQTSNSSDDTFDAKLPTIYFITPTYPRREQVPELTRLGQTLMHVKNLHWIVADDNRECNPALVKLLTKFKIPLTIMASPMPEVHRKNKSIKPRGVSNRRAALGWIRKHAKKGVLYFGDDDNTFDLDLFEEIRYTKRVSMFPVGLIGEFSMSSPVIHEGKVIGFFDSWPANRKFPVDMAGFAVSVEYFKKSPNPNMPYKAGYEEDFFLRSLGLRIDDIEPLADGCTKILVWHTRTAQKAAPTLHVVSETAGTSLEKLLDVMSDMGISLNTDSIGLQTSYIKLSGITTV